MHVLPGTNAQALLMDARQVPDEGEKWKIKVPRELTRVGDFSDMSCVAALLT